MVELDQLDKTVSLLRIHAPAAQGLAAARVQLLKLNRRKRRFEMSEDEQVRHEAERRKLGQVLLGIARAAGDAAPATSIAPPAAPTPVSIEPSSSVFLSYNHADSAAALALKSVLQHASIRVRIDVETMKAGQDIRAFVLESIRLTEATVCVVSKKSLISGWVALETAFTLYDDELWKHRKFIACYLDPAFLQPTFHLRAVGQIDRKIAQLEKLMVATMAKRLDTADLNSEKSRLYQARSQLAGVLQRLKDSLTLDIRTPAFPGSTARLLATLGSSKAPLGEPLAT